MRDPYMLAWLIAATLVAALLRLTALTEIPPGLHYDLAANAILVSDIAFGGARPIFITAYTGKEVLFFYSAAVVYHFVGESVFSLRLTAALWGILAVPTTYFAVRQVFAHWPHSRQIATAAAIIAATLFMHVAWSRFGFRAITEPVMQGLALGFLFRGLRRQTLSDLLLGGAFTGLVAYTYLAARLFPIPIALSFIALLAAVMVHQHQTLAARLRQGLAYGLAAAVVVAPLVWFFVNNPASFFTRIAQVAPRADQSSQILTGIIGSLGMLAFVGDPYDRYNLPGRPIFDLLQAGLFFLGLAMILAALPRRKSPVAWAAEVLLLAWVPVMLLPTALAVNEIFPSNLRAFGVLPLLLAYPAYGAVILITWLKSRWPAAANRLVHGSFVCLLGAGLLITSVDYFGRWANLATLTAANDTDLVNVAEYLNQHAPDNTEIYLSAIHYRHPTVAFLATSYPQIRWLTGGMALTVPADNAHTRQYYFPHNAPLPAEWLTTWQPYQIVAQTDYPPGAGFDAYSFAPNTAIPLPSLPGVNANFSFIATLTGAQATPSPDPNTLWVDLQFQVQNLPAVGDLQPYVRLTDVTGHVWSQAELFAYPSEQWQVGDVIRFRLPLNLPIGLPPDDYSLRVGLFAPSTGLNLAVIDEAGRYAGQRTPALNVVLAGPPTTTWPTPPLQTYGTSGLQLHSAQVANSDLWPGDWLELTLNWQANLPLPNQPLTIQLGDIAWQTDPVYGRLPFNRWETPTVLIDRQRLRIPSAATPGSFPLLLSWGDSTLDIGTVTVQPIDRQFNAPDDLTPVNAEFGGLLTLLGYQQSPNNPQQITLYWQALAQPNEDYTVFVHWFDENGTLVAQRDTSPQDGATPTRRLIAGQVLPDSHSVDLPPGTYTLQVGLYLPETGQHLTLPDGRDRLTLTPNSAP